MVVAEAITGNLDIYLWKLCILVAFLFTLFKAFVKELHQEDKVPFSIDRIP
jgi:hypothetical protein